MPCSNLLIIPLSHLYHFLNIPNPISQRHTTHTLQPLHFKYSQAMNIIRIQHPRFTPIHNFWNNHTLKQPSLHSHRHIALPPHIPNPSQCTFYPTIDVLTPSLSPPSALNSTPRYTK